MKISLNLKKYLNPAPNIGGLEISDLALRFVRIENSRLRQASVQMPPGIISGGKILDRGKLATALKGLHQQVDSLKKSLHVVLLIPTNNVYTQAFTMPLVPAKIVNETAKLNLQSISPIDTKSAYYGYQMIGETKQGQLEALGAFVNSMEVDDLTAVLREANFSVVSVEFPALAVTRLVKNYSSGLKADTPYLVVYLGSDGPDLMIVKNGHLYFNYFNSWSALQEEIGGRKISTADVQDFLARHIKQVINFYASRWGQPVQEVLLVDNPIAKEIINNVRHNFSLNVQPFQILKYGHLSPLWYGALGAAERGLIPRDQDQFISLTTLGVEQEYYRELALNFIKTWRNILVLTAGFMFLVLLVADSLLVRSAAAGALDLANRNLVPLNEIQGLQANVQKFNQALNYALKAQELTPAWSNFYSKMKLLTGDKVSMQRLFVDPALSGLLIGKAVNDSAVINFKNTMAKEPNFQDVILPLSNIKVNDDGTVSFSLNFKLTSLKF